MDRSIERQRTTSASLLSASKPVPNAFLKSLATEKHQDVDPFYPFYHSSVRTDYIHISSAINVML
jgi:hypothetical protein